MIIKRLDTGEGSYAKELEEDYDVADQLDQVCTRHKGSHLRIVKGQAKTPCLLCIGCIVCPWPNKSGMSITVADASRHMTPLSSLVVIWVPKCPSLNLPVHLRTHVHEHTFNVSFHAGAQCDSVNDQKL